jgi:MoxR-like ATPase
MAYKKIFAPDTDVLKFDSGETGLGVADQREGSVYVYNPEIVLAVNVALATRRPLLMRGPSGSGKSSLARNVANFLQWRYYETVVSSQTQARSLLWEVDLLRRLHDAQIPGRELNADLTPYINPGILWWAFNRESARRRGAEKIERGETEPFPDAREPNPQQYPKARAVVLIDEIDKAEPDVPNNLLVPLGSLQFQVEETGTVVKTTAKHAPLVFITTNDERELPAAFLRRCVEIVLTAPSQEQLAQIARAHFPSRKKRLLKQVAEHIMKLGDASDGGASRMASVAEYLDTVRACDELDVEPGSADWENVVRMTFLKRRQGSGESR